MTHGMADVNDLPSTTNDIFFFNSFVHFPRCDYLLGYTDSADDENAF